MHISSAKSRRGDQSPVIGIDSPFPPFKPDYRYRGVYERAGFDVNLRVVSPSEKRSMASLKSPNSPHFLGDRFYSSPAVSRDSNFHKSDLRKHSPVSFNETQPVYNSQYKIQDNFKNSGPGSLVSPTSTSTSTSNNPHPAPQSVASGNGRSQPPYVRPEIQPLRTDHRNARVQYTNGSKERLNRDRSAKSDKSDRSDRNIKHLQLSIPYNDSSFPYNGEVSEVSEVSGATEEHDSPFDRTPRSVDSTPSTSANSSEHFVPKTTSSSVKSLTPSNMTKRVPYPVCDSSSNSIIDIESSLGDLKNEMEEFKTFSQKRYPSSSSSKKTQTNPTTTNSSEYFSKRHTQSSRQTSRDSSTSFCFDTNRSSKDNQDSARNDFENFLQIRNREKPESRQSQISTVSSIISKHSYSQNRYGFGDVDDDEEDDVALELQRQLDQIKLESSISLITGGSDEIFKATTDSSLAYGQVSTCNVSNGDEEKSLCGTETTLNDARESRAMYPRVEPLKFTRKDDAQQEEPQSQQRPPSQSQPLTPHLKPTHSDDDTVYSPSETIKPLSPKTHSVEKELKNINFQYEDKECEMMTEREQSDEEILGKNPAPPEFEAFPKSVIYPKLPHLRTSTIPQKAPPGTGPCRACGFAINEKAKGPEKSISSKSGELSGQWHRRCFKCSYAGCSIHFNKEIKPYVLLDNAFCHHHYHTLNNTLCQTCHHGIEGECIENELKQKWHLSCLKCTKCSKAIVNDYFLINHQIVCEADTTQMIKDLKGTGLLSMDKVEKRRTRMLFIE